jgi:hypothetical protein
MLAWFSAIFRRPRTETYDEKADRIRGLIDEVVPAYGQIMEQSPVIVFPTSKLPLPKDEMKIALQLAWGMTTDEHVRGHVAAAYLHLAHFRDDIDSPIDPRLGKDMTPAQVVDVLDPYVAVSKNIMAETDGLMTEFQEFERLSLARAKR